MAKRSLSVGQRDKIADKLMLLGNIVFSGMVIAPLVSSPFESQEVFIAASGALLFGIFYYAAAQIMKGGGKE